MPDENHDNSFSLSKNEPYYCKECCRVHTKGKIYKAHLNYALFENNDNIHIEDEDIESELIDVFNEEKLRLPSEKEFKINDYITLKLEGGKTNIYVKDQLFRQCKFLMLSVPVNQIKSFDEIASIDEAADILGWRNVGQDRVKYQIDPETEFWGLCSNLQVWAENNYDTRLLHRNLAFPLLNRLSEVGAPNAICIFKEEISKRLESGSPIVFQYFLEELEGYFEYLNYEKKISIYLVILNNINKINDEMIKRNCIFSLISSIKGTALFSDNYNSIKKMFGNLLQRIDGDPFYYDESYLIGYSETIIQIMQETKLTEFLPDLLRKFEDVDESIIETTSMAFEDVIQLAKSNNLIREFFSQFLRTVKILLDEEYWLKYWEQKIPLYYEFVYALGTELVTIHFTELLNLADGVHPGYCSENFFKAFVTLFSEIKDTKLMKGNLSNLLKDIYHKYDAFLALVDVIKEPELMKEKILDVFALIDELIEDKTDNSFGYHAYAKLIDKFKEIELIDDYFIQLEERLFALLNKSKIEMYNFSSVIESISGTILINKNLDYIYERIDKLRYAGRNGEDLKIYSKIIKAMKPELVIKKYAYADEKLRTFSKIIKAMKPELVIKKFSYLFELIDKFFSDSFKAKAISNLIEEHFPYLINNKFWELLEAINTLSGDLFRFNIFLKAVYQLDIKDFKEKLALLKERYPSYTATIEDVYRDRGLL